jgi:hypothetical protein
MIGLAHKLKGPMASQSVHHKKYFAEVLVPTANLMREAGTILDEQVDITFGEGIIAFDDACKMMERMLMQDDDALVTAYRNSQVCPTLSFDCAYDLIMMITVQTNIKALFTELERSYSHRNKLLNNMRENFHQSGSSFLFLPLTLFADG